MRTRDISSAVVLLALTAWYAYLTACLPVRTLPNTPGPSFFPWVLTAGMALLSFALLLRGILETASGKGPASPLSSLPAFAGLALLLGYIVLLPYTGFLLTTPVFFGGFMLACGARQPVWLVGFSLMVPAVLYVVFEMIFQIPLPTGALLG